MSPTIEAAAALIISKAGHKVLRVCHLCSAGDSGEGVEIALYLAPSEDEADPPTRMTARLWKTWKSSGGMAARKITTQHVEVDDGW